VVTGANKGIGYGIVRGLAQQLSDAIIYLTARNPSLGEAALKQLTQELGEKAQSEVRYHQLDITDEASCLAFADHLRRQHGRIFALINNAGFAYKVDATESAGIQADYTIEVNYYGTTRISDHLAPLIQDGGRLVNVASQAGIMRGGTINPISSYKQELVDKFKDPKLTVADIDSFVEEYKRLAYEDRRKEGGYVESAYRVSKAATIALTMVQHRELSPRNIIVNACCPGYVNTDMTSHKGPLTLDQGADTPIYLTTDADVPQGKFVFQRKAMEWL